MSELVLDYQTSGSGLVYIAHPSKAFADLFEDWDLMRSQGFVWYLDYVGFSSRGHLYSYWAKVCLADDWIMKADTSRAILLPFTVPLAGNLLLGASTDLPVPFQLPPGKYKLLFETRYFTNDEIRSSGTHDFLLDRVDNPEAEVGLSDEDRPEMCFFTFVPTAEPVEPQILYPSYNKLMTLRWHAIERDDPFDPRRQLVLHNKPSPAYE